MTSTPWEIADEEDEAKYRAFQRGQFRSCLPLHMQDSDPRDEEPEPPTDWQEEDRDPLDTDEEDDS